MNRMCITRRGLNPRALLLIAVVTVAALSAEDMTLTVSADLFEVRSTALEALMGLDAAAPDRGGFVASDVPARLSVSVRPAEVLLALARSPGSVKLAWSHKLNLIEGKEGTIALGEKIQYMVKTGDHSYAVKTMEESVGIRLSASARRGPDESIDVEHDFSMTSVTGRALLEGAESLPIGLPVRSCQTVTGRAVVNIDEPFIAGMWSTTEEGSHVLICTVHERESNR